ncbi:unnamed protein product [Bacillus thuringiensis DB27]|uniref:Uncharacterized protein n=1 Tax=Bacillus thuringiensis DB27 TaxID=1431339 RepID=W8YCY1_BACTU|nr:unnamed protein product [Bacillus thuringiensis DB27]
MIIAFTVVKLIVSENYFSFGYKINTTSGACGV